MAKGKALTPPGRRLAQAGEAINIGLVCRNLARRNVLHNGVRPWRAKRNAVKRRHAHHIQHGIAQPIGVVALKEIGLAHRQRINRPQIERDIKIFRQLPIAANGQIAVG